MDKSEKADQLTESLLAANGVLIDAVKSKDSEAIQKAFADVSKIIGEIVALGEKPD